MTEHKFTDEKVIRALELHSSEEGCCLNKCVYAQERYCGSKMAKGALDIIKRQKAEIERLKEEVDRLTILAHGSKIKVFGKYEPHDYEQLTIDFKEGDT